MSLRTYRIRTLRCTSRNRNRGVVITLPTRKIQDQTNRRRNRYRNRTRKGKKEGKKEEEKKGGIHPLTAVSGACSTHNSAYKACSTYTSLRKSLRSPSLRNKLPPIHARAYVGNFRNPKYFNEETNTVGLLSVEESCFFTLRCPEFFL